MRRSIHARPPRSPSSRMTTSVSVVRPALSLSAMSQLGISMSRLYSKSTGTTYIRGLHTSIPSDAVELPDEVYQSVIANPAPGKVRSHDPAGLPILVDAPAYVPSADGLCSRIDKIGRASCRERVCQYV